MKSSTVYAYNEKLKQISSQKGNGSTDLSKPQLQGLTWHQPVTLVLAVLQLFEETALLDHPKGSLT